MNDKRKQRGDGNDSRFDETSSKKCQRRLHESETPPATPAISSNRAASRKTRVYVFREFVNKEYSLEPGSVVLDIAGGKGDLSWLLRNVDGVNSVVVDPRVTMANHIIRSIKYLKEHPGEAKNRAIPGLPTHQPLAALMPLLKDRASFDTPWHLRLLVDVHLVQAVKLFMEVRDEIAWRTYWDAASTRAIDTHPLGYQEQPSSHSATVGDAMDALKIILATKLVLGFHPDQATDSAFELAQLLGVPYCIVPCCVFPRENTHRRLEDGTPVKKYPQLIEYLTAKYAPETALLPFHFTETARSLVLYSKTSKTGSQEKSESKVPSS